MSHARALLWRLRLAVGGSALVHLRQLRRWSRLPLAEVRALQGRRLEALLTHAHSNVPYYREVLGAAGVVDHNGVNLERFHAVPLLDKAIIRARFHDLVAVDGVDRGAFTNTSGGSTGEPVKFVQDRETQDWKVAGKMLFDSWTGMVPGDRVALLWGSTRGLLEEDPSWRKRLGVWLRNELQLNAFHMNEERMRTYLELFNSFRPQRVLAYAQSLFQWATFLEGHGLSVHSPKSIMTSATTLDETMRATIERVFRAPVFDRYGSREVGDIACENGDGLGLVCAPTHHVEVLRSDGALAAAGETGELVVTLLTNFSMPLIRYRIGDAGVLASGPAGAIAWPRLQKVLGRTTDVFYTLTGDQVYGGYFTRLFYGLDWVAQFQVIQNDYDDVHIRIVAAEAADDHGQRERDMEAVRSGIWRVMGSACRIRVDYVDEIPVGPTGKRRYTISNVGPPPSRDNGDPPEGPPRSSEGAT